MRLHELAKADRHPLFVTLGDDDQVHGKLPGHLLDSHQRIPLRHLPALRVVRAPADHHFLERRLFDQASLERRRYPYVRLSHRHRVVHPVNQQRSRRAEIALRVYDRVALRSVFGRADVVDTRLLTAQLFPEALHHFRGFRNALTGVRDAWLLNPLLQVAHVLVDVLVDVGINLFQLLRLDHREIR